MVAHREVLLIPKLRRQIAEFLQHSSLKRLGILYQSTCVGFGYGLMRGLFPGTPSPPPESNNRRRLAEFVTTRWLPNIDGIPIGYAFRPRLRDRLTLRRLALRRNPWTFGDRVFHSVCRYSCQHSHFRCLQEPSRVSLRRLTERSATAPRDQPSAVRDQKSSEPNRDPGASWRSGDIRRAISRKFSDQCIPNPSCTSPKPASRPPTQPPSANGA